MNEHEIGELFREMRDEAIPADSLARVRMNVAERTQRSPRRRIAGWAAAIAALAFAGILLQSGGLLRKAVRPIVSSAPVISGKSVELPLFPAREAVRPAIQRVRRHPRPEPPVQTVSIRMETPDPDVVIWLVGN